MRISDWSSDVCSSDLLAAIIGDYQAPIRAQHGKHGGTPPLLPRPQADRAIIVFRRSSPARRGVRLHWLLPTRGVRNDKLHRHGRSEERRVGKECVSYV